MALSTAPPRIPLDREYSLCFNVLLLIHWSYLKHVAPNSSTVFAGCRPPFTPGAQRKDQGTGVVAAPGGHKPAGWCFMVLRVAREVSKLED